MRSKEEANDYRYFPDPDLLPLELDEPFIDSVAASLPELPDQKAQRFITDYALSAYDAGVLTAAVELADYFEAVVQVLGGHAKLAANSVMGELAGLLNRDGLEIQASRDRPAGTGRAAAPGRSITRSRARSPRRCSRPCGSKRASADAIIEERGLRQITDEGAIERAIDAVMAASPSQLADFRAGKDKLFGFFVGQVMKATAGKANPARLNELLRKKLGG
jgi:aspartyl-tRNA(Asn)/glutamyl-tRNA(Gln) amidotransferase subunit B